MIPPQSTNTRIPIIKISFVLFHEVENATYPQRRYWGVELLLLLYSALWFSPLRSFLSGISLIRFALLRRLCLTIISPVASVEVVAFAPYGLLGDKGIRNVSYGLSKPSLTCARGLEVAMGC